MAKPKPLTEPFVKEKILKLAKNSDFREMEKEKGDPDLVLSDRIKKYKHKIECKGIQKGKSGKYEIPRNQKAYIQALGQIVKCIKEEGVMYGIAFPNTDWFRKKVLEELPILARRRLDLYVYFVDKKERVHLLTPSAKKTKLIKKLPSSYRKKYNK